jgi:hypothetical protein
MIEIAWDAYLPLCLPKISRGVADFGQMAEACVCRGARPRAPTPWLPGGNSEEVGEELAVFATLRGLRGMGLIVNLSNSPEKLGHHFRS